MFVKVIKINNKNNIRFGTTSISKEKTIGEIMSLLRKHGCSKTLIMQDQTGFDQIGFELGGNSFMFTIPKVYIKNDLDERIGARIVYRFLETVLELTKDRVIDLPMVLLGARLVHDNQGRMTNVSEYLEPMLKDQFLLPERRV